MKSSFVLRDQLAIVLGGVGLLILLMELRWAAWPRYRTGIITALAVAFQTVILVGVTTIAVASVFAAPMLARTKVQKARAEEAAKNIEAKAQPATEPTNP